MKEALSLFREAVKTTEIFKSEVTIFGQGGPSSLNQAVPGNYSLRQQEDILRAGKRLGFKPNPQTVKSDFEWSHSVGHRTQELAARDVVAQCARDMRPDIRSLESKRKKEEKRRVKAILPHLSPGFPSSLRRR